MFADLRGFTRLAERLYAFDSVFLLNRYFAVMEQAIRRHGGVVDKLLGDGIMALFGATSTPERGSRDARRSEGAEMRFWQPGQCWKPSMRSVRSSTRPCPSRCAWASAFIWAPPCSDGLVEGASAA